MEDEKKPIAWRIGKQKFGKIKRNQTWKKRDTSRVMIILGPHGGKWKVEFQNDTRSMKIHTLRERDIYMYYMLID